MAVITEEAFEQLALEAHDTKWELICGRLREKPAMTMEHNNVSWWLGFQLQTQLGRGAYTVRVDAGYVRRQNSTYFGPDVMVMKDGQVAALRGTNRLETYAEPLPFVAEVWSPSTGDYDIDTKFPEYMARGDLEIWRVDPYAKTVVAWRRQADGSYAESRYMSGAVAVESLPGVKIELDLLFA